MIVYEHPTLFSGAMVRALLDDSKTKTRRVVTDMNTVGNWKPSQCDMTRAWVDPGPSPAGNPGPYLKAHVTANDNEIVDRLYPRYAVGDRLWVRETWTADFGQSFSDNDGAWWHEMPKSLRTERAVAMLHFAADDSRYHNPRIPDVGVEANRSDWEPSDIDREGMRWQPSIFMPRWASRITLELTAVGVERVQSISHEDVFAEGIERTNSSSVGIARERYQRLWDSLNAKRGYGWDVNPWVWVLTFRRVNS